MAKGRAINGCSSESYCRSNRAGVHGTAHNDVYRTADAQGGEIMASIIGDALLWLVGNEDVLILLVKFTVSLSLIYTLIQVWKMVEGGREDERI